MLKNTCSLIHQIGDRVFHLIVDADSPLNEVKDALLEFIKYVGKIEDAAKEQAKAQADLDAAVQVEKAPEEAKVEEVKHD
jgi:hypothetical protein